MSSLLFCFFCLGFFLAVISIKQYLRGYLRQNIITFTLKWIISAIFPGIGTSVWPWGWKNCCIHSASEFTSCWVLSSFFFRVSWTMSIWNECCAANSIICFLLRALQPPNWVAHWHCGVRVDANKKLVGFIAAIPADVRIYEMWVAHKYMQRCVFVWSLMSDVRIQST